MIKAYYKKHVLEFKRPAKTSRNTLTKKPTYFLVIRDLENDVMGIGECSTIAGLSPDPEKNYETKLRELCAKINFQDNTDVSIELEDYPSIKFGYEIAKLDFANGGKRIIFDTPFSKSSTPIPINGLVWMGEYDFMKKQVIEKIEQGFRCIKIKIGAIGFEEEYRLLKMIRQDFGEQDLELRVDANGAFSPVEAENVLTRLEELKIHSIEQPIAARQWQEMSKLCKSSPIPIALDEELIGINKLDGKAEVLDAIKPHYIILKPSLIGGLEPSQDWISLAEKNEIGWWTTSALESNIGLNAIAQWASTYELKLPQGLGTGQLYTNNINGPLVVNAGVLSYDATKEWDFSNVAGFNG